MGASVGKRGRRGGFTDINVTPLVDVMLVLLVVFMVTAPLLTAGLRIDLPEVEAAAVPVKDAKLLITITKEGRVLFGEEDITGKVPETLRSSARVQQEQQLFIRADKESRYGIVAHVVAAARSNGVSSLNLLVQPELEDSADGSPELPSGAPDSATKDGDGSEPAGGQ
jgi:biopolymer transport protein TolR